MEQDLTHLNQGQLTDLTSLKAEVVKIDVEKLKAVPVDLSKLRNVANNDFDKKRCMINQLEK